MSRGPHPLHNSEAGSHPLPSDKREIEAVLQATLRSYDAQPYLMERFGVRGEAYSRSDGGFLVTLASNPQHYVNQQVDWLCTLLVCRGMPRFLMERHLYLLAEELTRLVPSRAKKYRKLERAADRLRDARCARLPQSEFEALAAAFTLSAGGGIAGVGELLISAACDEADGLEKALPSLLSWLRDEEHFTAEWCLAIDGALKQIRSRMGRYASL